MVPCNRTTMIITLRTQEKKRLNGKYGRLLNAITKVKRPQPLNSEIKATKKGKKIFFRCKKKNLDF